MSWSKEKDQAFVCGLFTETSLDSHHRFDLLCEWKDCFSPMAMRWYTVSARECVFKGGKRSSKCNEDGDDKNSAPCRSNPGLFSVCIFFESFPKTKLQIIGRVSRMESQAVE